jgi:hypothetical protein
MKIGAREIVAVSAILIQIALVTTALSIKDMDELADPDISIEVIQTRFMEGKYLNYTPIQGKLWQIVHVNITNLNEEHSFDVPYWAFFGYAEDGERIWPFNSDEASVGPVEPGENATLMLIFDVPQGTRLVELEYIQRVSYPIRVIIPNKD